MAWGASTTHRNIVVVVHRTDGAHHQHAALHSPIVGGRSTNICPVAQQRLAKRQLKHTDGIPVHNTGTAGGVQLGGCCPTGKMAAILNASIEVCICCVKP